MAWMKPSQWMKNLKLWWLSKRYARSSVKWKEIQNPDDPLDRTLCIHLLSGPYKGTVYQYEKVSFEIIQDADILKLVFDIRFITNPYYIDHPYPDDFMQIAGDICYDSLTINDGRIGGNLIDTKHRTNNPQESHF